MRRIWIVLLSLLAVAGCGGGQETWVYQLEGYAGGRLDQVAAAEGDYAVIDLARDGGSDWFRRDELAKVQGSGKQVLAYFSIGSIEKYRPEHKAVAKLKLNRWADWPDEHFVRYWDELWWTAVVRPRLDQAIAAGFDGAYLDVPLAYEEIDLALVKGETRDSLAAKMTALIVRASEYAKQKAPGFLIVPQNSPELRHQPGYVHAIDGIGVEDLFFRAHDEPCTEEWCAENLANVRALKAAGKFVLAVDYAKRPENVEAACAHYREEGFAGYVTTVELDRIARPC